MDRVRTVADRVFRAWRGMAPEQRLASIAALVLLATLFLPWYEKSVYDTSLRRYVEDTLTGFGSADFVMASVVLVALAVLAMTLARGEGRGFHLPGGDGIVIMVAGGWCALLIFYRVLDHPDVSGEAATIGIQWGVFVAFLAAAFLVYAGFRIRLAHRPEPPLPLEARRARRRPPGPSGAGVSGAGVSGTGARRAASTADADAPRASSAPAPRPSAPDEPATAPTQRGRRRPPSGTADDEPPIPGQMSFDEAETQRMQDR